ncbi:MAG TPA: hypothetical protein VLL76_09405 [Candidatus Omnitrophota bacterium]|nr:hypothetical protein [Candidatus Omnitrophota bacterium]
MLLAPLPALALLALLAVLALTLSSWWWLPALAWMGWIAFDGWARGAPPGTITLPGRKPPPFADSTKARLPAYVIGDFLTVCGMGRRGAVLIATAEIAEIIGQCKRECRRVGHPRPPMVMAMECLEAHCAGCGLEYGPWLKQAWRDATAKGGTELTPGAVPDGEGRCPRCGGTTALLVFDC